MKTPTFAALCSLPVLPALFLAGCAKTTSYEVRMHDGHERLPRPDRILVHDFAVSHDEVSINSAIGARITNFVTNTSTTEEQKKVGKAVAFVLAEEIVKGLRELQLSAERVSTVTPPPNKILTVEGQFISIDEGNRLRRMVIGFGAGGSEVRTQVQVSLGTATGRLLLEEFVTDAESSKKPGMGPMAGVGGAVGTVGGAAMLSAGVGGVTEMDQTVEGDAKRTAKEIVQKLSLLFAKQGWITAEQVPR